MKPLSLLVFLFTFLMILSSTIPVSAQSPIGMIDGMVLQVSDGCNLTISSYGTEISVRLYGVDAPVMVNADELQLWRRRQSQSHAREAFMTLANKVLHQNVKIEIMTMAFSKRPPHHRVVAIVLLDGRDINREMLSEGWGWVLMKDLDRFYFNAYIAAEHHARIKKLGLWAGTNPIPPWEFRRMWRCDERAYNLSH